MPADMKHAATPGRPGLVLALCILALMIDGADIQLMAFAAPQVIDGWGISKAALAPALAAALAGMTVGAAIGGMLGDRMGRRPAILVSLLVSGVLTLATGFAADVPQLVLLRLVAGIGYGALYPNAFALIAETVAERRRAQTIILATIGTPLGGVLGAAVCSVVLPAYGWQSTFMGAGGLTLLACAAMYFLLHESPDFLRAVRQAVKPKGAGLLAPGYVRRTTGLWVLALASGYAGFAFLHWVPTLLASHGFSVSLAVAGSFALNAALIVGTLGMAAAIRRIGSKRGLVLAIVLVMSGTVLLATALSAMSGLPVAVFVALVLIGAGVGAVASVQFVLCVELYPVESRARGGGTANAMSRLGAVAVAFGAAAALGGDGGNAVAFGFMVVTALALAMVGALIIDRHVVPAAVREGTDSPI
ncbi:MFS transporter [Niveispirillum sp.]|uniref:MFS transporter n=1 Tax=Niveispirillum sp. TaxID=1917217 RepID=UPI001B5107FD|nr:MFS transporter [Niveispirillum sp.]MBP7338618.1 MFS transporter [Niveispirillum sp.]